MLGSGDVDLCLVPEVPADLHGDGDGEGGGGILPYLRRLVQKKGYAVVVVAEG